ncbi:MAG TPA: D-alanyl-D-alanine carboxypeptidase/D-alanyl-D-alanine-endopeptidase [Longimicrobiales bacterium]
MIHPILLVLLLGSRAVAAASPAAAPQAGTKAPLAAHMAASSAASAATVGPAVAALRADLARLIDGTGWDGARWSVMAVSLDRGDTIFAYQPDMALAPASNMKLFTTAAALYYLGPDFRYGTYLMTEGVVRGGVLEGDLIVYGTGDPTLSDRFYESKTAVWEAFADSLAALGIREIRGDVVGDASYFDGDGTGLGWQEDYMNAWYAAPASALSFNENIVTLLIKPGEQAGWRPALQLVPGGEGIAIVNEATTVRGGRTWIDVNRAAYDGPIVIRGRISAGSPGVWRAVPVADPARFAAAVLREVLESRGIVVRGGVRSIHSPDASPLTRRTVHAPAFDRRPPLRVLAVHQSPSLLDILTVVNKKSHNLYAEAVLRTVGRVATGAGNVRGGARAVYDLLECELGLDTLALRIFDGSGLSVLNRVSARTVTHLLAYMARSPVWPAYWATLPEAGDPHGLRRMHRTPAAGNLRAKTGTIDHVSALSGYVRAANGERLAFSIISNDVPSTWRAKRVEDAIGVRLARFDRPFPAGSTPTAPGVAAPAPPAADSLGAIAGASSPGPTASSVAGPVAWPVPPATDGPAFYVIRKGDNLESIAKRYGTTVSALRAANPGIEPRRLIPGRRLRLR